MRDVEDRVVRLEKANRRLWLALLVVLTAPLVTQAVSRPAVGIEPKKLVTDVIECREVRLVDGGNVLGGFKVITHDVGPNSHSAYFWLQKNDREMSRWFVDRFGSPKLQMTPRIDQEKTAGVELGRDHIIAGAIFGKINPR